MPGMTCNVAVSPELTDFWLWDGARQAAWLTYIASDPTQRYPGFTVHGSVTVTASDSVHMFFIQVLTHQPDVNISATQTAILVTGV
jgi:hypothetical protein